MKRIDIIALFRALGVGALLLGASSAMALNVEPLGIGAMPTGEIVLTAKFTLDPHDIVPWHYHSGYGWATILQGTLTHVDGCGNEEEHYTAGTSFKEEAGMVHLAYNAGPETLILLWTEIFPACQEPTSYVDGPNCAGNSEHPVPVKIPECR